MRRKYAAKWQLSRFVVICGCMLVLGGSISWHSLSAAAKPAAQSDATGPYLLSLGGSIAAGVGLQGPYHSSHYHVPAACGQTDYSYAVILARDEHLPLLQVACSGAQTSQGLFAGQMVNHQLLRPQLMAVKAEARNSVATIFIGANDAHWIHLEHVCFSQGCPPQNSPYFTEGLSTVSRNIVAVISDLHQDGVRAIIINEYYTALTQNNSMSCQTYHLSAADITRYQTMLGQLNNAIISGYSQSHISTAYLVPLNFGGHGICSRQPWVQGLADTQPFHPTSAGQEAIANADAAVLASHGV
jgi:lysophospholipase L1-like esterase